MKNPSSQRIGEYKINFKSDQGTICCRPIKKRFDF